MKEQRNTKLGVAVVLALGLSVGTASAVGLGPIQVNSHKGQPLQASIKVDGLTYEQAKTARVSLASQSEYSKRGVKRGSEVVNLRLIPSGSGYRIAVNTGKKVDADFVNFVVSFNSDGKEIVREYSAFLKDDPNAPVVVNNTKKATVAKETSRLDGNKDSRADSQDSKTKKHRAEQEKRKSKMADDANSEAGRSISRIEEVKKNGNKYVVRRGDSLSSIAKSLRPAGVSTEDMMRAIYAANAHAFGKNMSSLSAGATLTIPTDINNSEEIAKIAAENTKNTENAALNPDRKSQIEDAINQQTGTDPSVIPTQIAENVEAQQAPVQEVAEPENNGLMLDSTDSIAGIGEEPVPAVSLEQQAQQAVTTAPVEIKSEAPASEEVVQTDEEEKGSEETVSAPAVSSVQEEPKAEQEESKPVVRAEKQVNTASSEGSHGNGLILWAVIAGLLALFLYMLSKIKSYGRTHYVDEPAAAAAEENKYDDNVEAAFSEEELAEFSRMAEAQEAEEREHNRAMQADEEDRDSLAEDESSAVAEVVERPVSAEYVNEDEFLKASTAPVIDDSFNIDPIKSAAVDTPVASTLSSKEELQAELEEIDFSPKKVSDDKWLEVEEDYSVSTVASASAEVQSVKKDPEPVSKFVDSSVKDPAPKPAAKVVVTEERAPVSSGDEEDFFSELVDNEESSVKTIEAASASSKSSKVANNVSDSGHHEEDEFASLAGSEAEMYDKTMHVAAPSSSSSTLNEQDDFGDLTESDHDAGSKQVWDFNLGGEEQTEKPSRAGMMNSDTEQQIVASASASAMQSAYSANEHNEADTHAMAINLDLAAAYINSGIKPDKARAWLNEVLKKGTDIQKGKAKVLLERLGNK